MVPLPMAPGCDLQVSTILTDIPMTAGGSSFATLPISVPNDMGLLGFVLDMQAIGAAPGINPAGLYVSNLGRLVVGEI